MTIKIEREALLCVLTQPPCPEDGDEYINVSCGKDGESPCFFVGDKGESSDLVEKLRRPIRCDSFDSLDDDDTVTTASCSSASSLGDDKRVSFAQELVTDVWERPRTPPEDVPKLFFSASETTRFRQEYRLERKLLAELDVDPETHPVDQEELSALFASQASSTDRHRISRVVVLHNDKLETFLNPPLEKEEKTQGDDFFDSDSFWSGSITWF